MVEFNCHNQGYRATTRMQFTVNRNVTKSSSYAFNRSPKRWWSFDSVKPTNGSCNINLIVALQWGVSCYHKDNRYFDVAYDFIWPLRNLYTFVKYKLILSLRLIAVSPKHWINDRELRTQRLKLVPPSDKWHTSKFGADQKSDHN